MKFFVFIKILMGLILSAMLYSQTFTAEEILKKVDANIFSQSSESEIKMIVHSERGNREISLRSYTVGSKKSFSEFLSPKREKGVKMLKLNNQLWIYSPSTDRTIQLSGHLLRQSMMGSDISYEDMMEDRRLFDVYRGEVVDEERIEMEQDEKVISRSAYVLELIAKVEDVNYIRRKIWVDKEYFLPLQEELYSKSKVLLKKLNYGELVKVGKRWVAKKVIFKDMLKSGKGTEMIVNKIEFNPNIPSHIFSKAILRR